MILAYVSDTGTKNSVLHVCGDDPGQQFGMAGKTIVFSTYVEMILSLMIDVQQQVSVLHVSGGDPVLQELSRKENTYSPRKWR